MANDELMRLAAKWRSENGDYPESKRDCADELERALAQRAPLHGAVPEGYVLAPRVADVNMINAARAAGAAFGFGHHYNKALAAAPAPDQSPDAGKMVPCRTRISGHASADDGHLAESFRAGTAIKPEAERAKGEAHWEAVRRARAVYWGESVSSKPPPAGQPEGVEALASIYRDLVQVLADIATIPQAENRFEHEVVSRSRVMDCVVRARMSLDKLSGQLQVRRLASAQRAGKDGV